MSTRKGLKERLAAGESIICAEGYLLEFDRRGYLQAGNYFPDIVLDHPEIVEQAHEEFVHAGSDVVEAFTFYCNREKMKVMGKENLIEKINRDAIRLAKRVAEKHGCLVAGNFCNTGMAMPEDRDAIRASFVEQVRWAKEEGVDFIIAETFKLFSEAMLALEVIKEFDLPAVVNIAPYASDVTADDIPLPKALKMLEDNGATVVGLNCGRGPETMLPLLKEVRKTCKGPIAALPVAYRTTDKCKAWQALKDPYDGTYSFPANLQCHQSTRKSIRAFAEEARALGVQYIGVCCGNSGFYTREVAEAYGRTPPASKYRPDMTNSLYFGDETKLSETKKKLRKHMLGNDDTLY